MHTFQNTLRSLIVISVIFTCFSIGQEKQLAAGKEALQKGDYIRAIEQLREATHKDKKSGEAFFLLGTALYKADSLDEANVAAVQAKELDPNNASIYMLIGDIYAKQKITPAAIDQYKKATDLDPKNLEILIKLAEAQKKNRQYNDAANSYQAVLNLDSMNITALNGLGSIYYRAKIYLKALDYIAKLTKLFPDSIDYEVKFVKCLSEAQRWQELLPIAEVLVQKDPSLTETQDILDHAYFVLKMNRKVIDSYRGRNPESLKIDDLLRYVKALQSEQVYDTAEVIYELIFKKDSARCDLRYYFGTNEMKLKKWAAAVKQFDKKIECDTSAGFRWPSHLNAAMSLMQLKKFNEGVEHTKKAIEYKPENIQAWTVLAECYGQLYQIDDEITSYKKVIELAIAGNSNGDEGKYDAQLQEAYRMIGVRKLIEATKDKEPKTNKAKYEEAAKYLKNAVQLNPKDCQALLWLAQSYQNSNDKDNAIKYYRKLLENCPKSKEAEDAKKGLKTLGVE